MKSINLLEDSQSLPVHPFHWSTSERDTSKILKSSLKTKINIHDMQRFSLYFTKTIWLMLYRETATIYYRNHKEHGGKTQKSFKKLILAVHVPTT